MKDIIRCPKCNAFGQTIEYRDTLSDNPSAIMRCPVCKNEWDTPVVLYRGSSILEENTKDKENEKETT